MKLGADHVDSVGRTVQGEIYRRGAFGHRPRVPVLRGIEAVMRYLMAELDITTALAGCTRLAEVDRDLLRPEA